MDYTRAKILDLLRQAMISEPALVCPRDDLIFHIWADASPFAGDGVVTQDQGKGYPPVGISQNMPSMFCSKFAADQIGHWKYFYRNGLRYTLGCVQTRKEYGCRYSRAFFIP